jgi:D-serine deaminase-like pyridoxal phosphate-dependent protein
MTLAITPVGLPKEKLDTPALLVDLDVLQSNIARIAGACRAGGVAWRPHTKGIKVPAIAHMLLRSGAIGVTCAKLGEAEIMASAGINNILIANQIVGEQKILRLVNLRRHADVMVAVDDPDNVGALDAAARSKGVKLGLLIEVDIGIGRAGVPSGEPAVSLAELIGRHANLELRGVMGWEGQATEIRDPSEKVAAIKAAVGMLAATAERLRGTGHSVEIVSCGGTGTYETTSALKGITEIQAGGGIFSDIRYRTKMHVNHPYALTVMTTVTSRPSTTRIICDAGKKTMSGDAALPFPLGLDHVASIGLSAEHATINLQVPNDRVKIGDRLEFVVGYSDTTVHLHDEIYGTREGRVEIVWPVLGRGQIR